MDCIALATHTGFAMHLPETGLIRCRHGDCVAYEDLSVRRQKWQSKKHGDKNQRYNHWSGE
jgi:hypothetical protein